MGSSCKLNRLKGKQVVGVGNPHDLENYALVRTLKVMASMGMNLPRTHTFTVRHVPGSGQAAHVINPFGTACTAARFSGSL